MKFKNWCLTQPFEGLNYPKGFLSEVIVSLKMIGGISCLKKPSKNSRSLNISKNLDSLIDHAVFTGSKDA